MPQSKENTLDSFVPDYEAKCINCGQSPCVTGVKAGDIVYRSDMCDPCTFGEAETIDPLTW